MTFLPGTPRILMAMPRTSGLASDCGTPEPFEKRTQAR